MKNKAILLIVIVMAIASLGSSQSNCYSSLSVSLTPNEAVSGSGFTIYVDKVPMGVTGPQGLTIDLSMLGLIENQPCTLTLAAIKKDKGSFCQGGKSINIPCYNSSCRRTLQTTIDVSCSKQNSSGVPRCK